jgi:hypothetical protein
MRNKKQLKTLSFEPVYYRRVSQGQYAITLKATKGARMASFKAAIAERDEILAQGFTIVEIDIERPCNGAENVDKGDVAAVIANTNPLLS